jgi:hypothetical protein
MCQFDKVAAHQALEVVIRTVSRLKLGLNVIWSASTSFGLNKTECLNLAKAVIESGAEPQGPSAHGLSCTATAYVTPVLLGPVANAGAEAFDRAAQLR